MFIAFLFESERLTLLFLVLMERLELKIRNVLKSRNYIP